MRIVFMGTPDFSVPVLQALLDHGHEIVAVYCQPPRPAGRGKKLRPSPVHVFADLNNLPVYDPVSLKSPAQQKEFSDHAADIAVVVAYGLILPQAILDMPVHGCINVHASLLPRWRGAAPIQRAIMAGDRKTGVTIMQMEAGLDTGPMLVTKETGIDMTDTASALHDRLSDMGARLVISAINGIAEGQIKAVPQPEDGVTYANKITKAEARLRWDQPAASLVSHIHGLSPFPGAWFQLDGARVKVIKAHVSDQSTTALPGTVIGSPLLVACNTGVVGLDILQREGKGAMKADDLLRGYPVPIGRKLD